LNTKEIAKSSDRAIVAVNKYFLLTLNFTNR
jgi:hypothetical protein